MYRMRDTGEIVTASVVLERKPKGLLVPPESSWNERIMSRLGVDLVRPSKQPEHDERKFVALPNGAIKKGRYYIQKWKIHPRYESVIAEREAAITQVKRLCVRRIMTGRVTVDGVYFKTDQASIAFLSTAAGTTKPIKVINGEQVLECSVETINNAKSAVDAYVQACFDNAANLIDKINSSDDPLIIDIGEGWPQ
jgi:hypothetical protein